MAQAHLSSLDMTSVDKEDTSSEEEEEEEREKKSQQSQQTASATGGSHRFFTFCHFLSYPWICITHRILFLSDPREESRPPRDQCVSLDSLPGSKDLSHHHAAEEKAKEREEGKGE